MVQNMLLNTAVILLKLYPHSQWSAFIHFTLDDHCVIGSFLATAAEMRHHIFGQPTLQLVPVDGDDWLPPQKGRALAKHPVEHLYVLAVSHHPVIQIPHVAVTFPGVSIQSHCALGGKRV